MRPKIEDIKIDMELLQAELKLKSEKYTNFIMRKYCGGYCNRCSNMPTKKVSYNIGGAQLVEFYCDNCFKYMKEGRSERDIDKLN
jgi:hypothetical protein